MILAETLRELYVLSLNPNGFWRMNETSGTVMADFGPNAMDGAFNDSTMLGHPTLLHNSEDTSCYFDGAHYAAVLDNPLLDTGNAFSIEVLFLWDGAAGDRVIVDKGTGGYQVLLNGGTIYLAKSGVGLILNSSVVCKANQIYHLLVTKSGGAVKIYLNGVDVSITLTDRTIVDTSDHFVIGRYQASASGYWSGRMQHFAFYPSALTAANARRLAQLALEPYGETPIFAVHIQNADASGPSYRFATATPKNSGNWDRILEPGTIARDVDPRESRFNTGSFTFGLKDIAGAATAAIGDIVGKQCTLYSLDRSTDFNDADILFRGIVQEFDLQDKVYQVTARSPIVLADRTLFNGGRTTLAAAIDADDTAAILVDASGLDSSGVVIVDEERIGYTGIAANTLTGLTRGLYGSTAAAHAINANVTETFILEGHPCDIFAAVLTGTGKTGAGLPAAYVNTSHLAAQKTLLGASYEMFFEITEAENAKSWLEREILKAIGAYPWEDAQGRQSLKIFSTASSTVDSIRDADATARPVWTGNFPLRVNHVIYLYDWDPVAREFRSAKTAYRDAGLIELFGEFPPLVIEAKGLHSDLPSIDAFFAARGEAYVQRFGLQLPTIQVETLFKKRYLEAADDVATTFAQLVNVSAGAIGLSSAPAELISVHHDLAAKRMRFTLIAHQPIFDVFEAEESTGETNYPTFSVA